jgi:outer membrane protein TolC
MARAIVAPMKFSARPSIFLAQLGFIFYSLNSVGMEVREFAKVFVEMSPALASLREEVKAAENEEREASRNLFPAINWQTSFTDQQISRSMYGIVDFFPTKIYSSALAFNQPLYMGGKIMQAWDLKKQSVQISKFQYSEQEQILLSQALNKYFQLFSAVKIKEVLKESQKIQDQFLKLIKDRRNRGAAKDFELSQAYGNYASYESRIQQQEALILQMKLDLESELLIEDLNTSAMNLELPQKNQVQLKNETLSRPDVKLIEKQIDLAQIQKELTLGDHYPSLNLQGSWGFESRESDNLFDPLSERYAVTLGLNIPLFSGGTSIYAHRASEHKITSAKIQLKKKLDQIRAEFQSSEYKIKMFFLALESNLNWMNQAQKALDEGLRSFRLGTVQTFQVVQLQREYEGAAIAYFTALQNFYAEKVTGLRTSGLRILQHL